MSWKRKYPGWLWHANRKICFSAKSAAWLESPERPGSNTGTACLVQSMEELGELRQIHSLNTLEDHLHIGRKIQSPNKKRWIHFKSGRTDSIVTLKTFEELTTMGFVPLVCSLWSGRYAQAQMQPGGSENADERCLRK